MRTLRRAIFLEISASFGLGILAFNIVLLTNEVSRRLMETLVQENITLQEATFIFLCVLPKILTFSIPMSALLGILICFGRLSADNEITAMRSSGIGLKNLCSPVLCFATAAGILALWNSNIWSPQALHELVLLKDKIAFKSATTAIQTGVFEERFSDRVLYIRDATPDKRYWRGIFLADLSDHDSPKTTFARRGYISNDIEQNGEPQLHLSKGASYEIKAGKEGTVQVVSFDETTVPLYSGIRPPPKASKDKRILEMDSLELYENFFSPQSSMDSDPITFRKAIIELNRRLALPFAVVVFSILGLPLGVVTKKGGKSVGFVISLVIFLIYFILFSQGIAFSESGHLPAFMGPWVSNLAFLVLGLFLLVTAEKRFAWSKVLGPLTAIIRKRLPKIFTLKPFNLNASLFRGGWTHGSRFQSPIPVTLDKYVVFGFLKFFLLVLAAFTIIFVTFTFFELLSDILEQEVGNQVVMNYFFYLMPHILVLMVPFSVLVAVLVNFSLLTRTSQIVAIKSAGISLYRLSSSVLAVALLMSALSFGLQEYILPAANQKQDDLRRIIKGRKAQTKRPVRKWMMGEANRIFHYKFFDDNLNIFHKIIILDFEPETFVVTQVISAEKALWDKDRSSWMFEKGWVQGFEENRANRDKFLNFEKKIVPEINETPLYFKKEVRQSSQMSYQELKKHIEDLKQSGFDVVRLTVALHKKVAFPLVPLIMGMIAVPFAFSTGKRGSLYGIGLSIFIGISYWVFQGFFEQLGSAGKLTPLLAAWAPNLIFGAGGIHLLFTIRT